MNWTKSLLNDERSAQQAHAGRASDKRQRAMARRRRAALPPPRLRAATPAALDGSESAATAKPLPNRVRTGEHSRTRRARANCTRKVNDLADVALEPGLCHRVYLNARSARRA